MASTIFSSPAVCDLADAVPFNVGWFMVPTPRQLSVGPTLRGQPWTSDIRERCTALPPIRRCSDATLRDVLRKLADPSEICVAVASDDRACRGVEDNMRHVIMMIMLAFGAMAALLSFPAQAQYAVCI